MSHKGIFDSNNHIWEPYLQRYRNNEWRTIIFRDLIMSDMQRLNIENAISLLDIGCGGGFDGDKNVQSALARNSGNYIGVEPDEDIELSPIFTSIHRCLFEDAPIPLESVDIAFAVMVLEHIPRPEIFWNKLHAILKPDGIFWGFTMDSRHWFKTLSVTLETLHVKNWYLKKLHGKRGEERYENYPVHYKCNNPKRILNLAASFKECTILNFKKVGELDYYLPSNMKWLGRTIDRVGIKLDLPGSVLAVRVVK